MYDVLFEWPLTRCSFGGCLYDVMYVKQRCLTDVTQCEGFHVKTKFGANLKKKNLRRNRKHSIILLTIWENFTFFI